MPAAGGRFTTYERVEPPPGWIVVSRDGTRVPFSRDNIMRRSGRVRQVHVVPEEVKDKLVSELDEELHRDFDREVESRVIGDMSWPSSVT